MRATGAERSCGTNVKTTVRNVFDGKDGQLQLRSDNAGAGGLAGILI